MTTAFRLAWPPASQCQSCTTRKALKQTTANSKNALAPMCVKPKHFRDWDGGSPWAPGRPWGPHNDTYKNNWKAMHFLCSLTNRSDRVQPPIPSFIRPARWRSLSRTWIRSQFHSTHKCESLRFIRQFVRTKKRCVLLTSPSVGMERRQHGQRALQALQL